MLPIQAANARRLIDIIVPVDSPVRGTVRAANGELLPGVNVVVKGALNGSTTDGEGRFVLNAPDDAILVFSSIGYSTQEVPRNARVNVDITLTPDTKTLNEVVVVGFGRQSRETVTTSITKLDNKVLENVPFANAASALQGTVAGVRVQSLSGQPGAAPRIIVRGGTSINNPNGAAPLYIIDGVIRTNMNDISPDDIESLQVLKDAASTAIYGARGSNGVVIITTRSGKAGKTRVTYGYDFTVGQTTKRYEFASAAQYVEIGRLGLQAASRKVPTALLRLTLPNGMGTGNDLTNNTAFTTQFLNDQNRAKLQQGWQSIPDPLDPTKTIIFQDTDFQNLLFQTSLQHNNHVSISGGTDKATFNAGLGYFSGTGTVITTKYNRLTFNLNGDVKVRDNLSVFGRTLYTNSVNNAVWNEFDIFGRTVGLPNTAKYRFEDGTLAPGQARSLGNPEYHLPNRNDEGNVENITLSTGFRWEPIKGLFIEPIASLYRVNDAARTFLPSFQNGAGLANLNTTRQATVANSRLTQTQLDAVATYLRTLGGMHNLEAKLGYSYFKRNLSNFNATGQGAATDLIPTLNVSSVFPVVSSTISDLLILGYFGRLNYDYKQKYLLTVNARYDGASNLGAANRWGFFPGVAAGWNLHQEEFWAPISPVVSRLKLRGSYGINGNISGLSDFQAQGEYGIPTTNGQQRYNGVTGIQQTLLPNPDLQWERSKTLNGGADIGLFNNRISILFDIYRRVTDDLLTTLTLPQSTGVASIFTNLGSLENKGVELELNTQITKDNAPFGWNFAVNGSHTTHRVLKLPPSGAEGNRVGGIQVWDAASRTYIWVPANNGLIEGGRIGDLYAYKALGVYATDEEAKSAPVDNVIPGDKTKRGGDVIWQDTDGDGDIDDRDRVYVGNQFPTWTGGFTNTFSYKNFSLLARLDFTVGHTIYNYARAFFDGNFQGDVNMTKEMAEKSWKKQGDVTDVPRYYWQDQSVHNFWRGGPDASFNSNYGERGDFLCVREVTMSYVVPSPLLQRLKLANLRVNLTGANLYYFTKYKGLNPEDGGWSPFLNRRGDRGRFPLPRNITFGATISF